MIFVVSDKFSLCHTLWFSIYIVATQPYISQTMRSVKSNNVSLKY